MKNRVFERAKSILLFLCASFVTVKNMVLNSYDFRMKNAAGMKSAGSIFIVLKSFTFNMPSPDAIMRNPPMTDNSVMSAGEIKSLKKPAHK